MKSPASKLSIQQSFCVLIFSPLLLAFHVGNASTPENIFAVRDFLPQGLQPFSPHSADFHSRANVFSPRTLDGIMYSVLYLWQELFFAFPPLALDPIL
jgi:hypothetical protein